MVYTVDMKYVITGGDGFIGGHIVEATGGYSYDIKHGEDILDTKTLGLVVTDADGIFHCAAKISVPESVVKPEEYHQNNVVGMQYVLDAAKTSIKKPKVVFSSSAAVYGEYNTAVQEDAALHPASPYGQNKCDGEELLKNAGVNGVVLRYFNVYGPGQSLAYAGVITIFIQKALKGEDLIIYGNGNAVRDFIYIDDIVSANIAAMNYTTSPFEIFNIGTGIETTMKALAETIITLTKSSSKIKYEKGRPGDVVYSRADISKTQKTLGWSARVSLEDGLRKTIAAFRI